MPTFSYQQAPIKAMNPLQDKESNKSQMMTLNKELFENAPPYMDNLTL